MVSPRKKGFTLIELLVVIAIIAVLAAILFPVFSTAKAAGQKAACGSNMQQLGHAVTLYSQEWGEKIPGTFIWLSATEGKTFVEYLRPYTKNMEVFSCPMIKCNYTSIYWQWQTSYFMTDCIFNNGERRFTKLSEMRVPTRVVVLMDCAYRDETKHAGLDWYQTPEDFADTLNGVGKLGPKWWYRFCRHQGGANCAFADGHAKWIKKGEFKVSMFSKSGH